jgi:hypothetical protein
VCSRNDIVRDEKEENDIEQNTKNLFKKENRKNKKKLPLIEEEEDVECEESEESPTPVEKILKKKKKKPRKVGKKRMVKMTQPINNLNKIVVLDPDEDDEVEIPAAPVKKRISNKVKYAAIVFIVLLSIFFMHKYISFRLSHRAMPMPVYQPQERLEEFPPPTKVPRDMINSSGQKGGGRRGRKKK